MSGNKMSPEAAKIFKMLQLQNEINIHVDGKDWIEQGRPYYRAAWMEAAELLDHVGWKWWKKIISDMAQAQMELVDIWHFAMSDWIKVGAPINLSDIFTPEVCQHIADSINNPDDINDIHFVYKIERFINNCITNMAIDIQQTTLLFKDVDLNVDALYKMYIGKNALNHFRKDNGYATGEYDKIWFGKEDNVHLANILNSMTGDSDTFYDEVYDSLVMMYSQRPELVKEGFGDTAL